MHKKKGGKVYCCLIAAVFVAALGVFFLLQIVSPDKTFSELENRNLQTAPQFSISQVISGRYSTHTEKWVADQFPFRSGWIQIKELADRVLGKVESNHIFLAKKGYLIEDFIGGKEENYRMQMDGLRRFAKGHPNLKQSMLVAPTAVNIYEDLLPAFAKTGNQDAYLDRIRSDVEKMGITFVDVRDTFRATDEIQLYYKTDHHWTTDGAYLAYQKLAETLGWKVRTVYNRIPVTDSFSGTMTASSGFRMREKEPIYVYLPDDSSKNTVQYTVNYVAEAEKTASLYCTEKLDQRDQYEVFLGGNHPLVKICTTAETGRTLLVVKDSYANCFLPFLVEHYDKILVVDPRYYSDSLSGLVNSEQVTDVLYLYNANTLAQDSSLVTVLE